MNKLIIFTTLLVTGFLTAQISENREVADFSKLKASSSVEVLYTISDKISITVETDDADKMKYVKTEVEGETLNIYVEQNADNLAKSKKKKNKVFRNWVNGIEFNVLKVTISGPNLNDIKVSSSAKVEVLNLNKSNIMQIAVSSSGYIKGNFECNTIDIIGSSSGQILANVFAKMASVATSSSSIVTLQGNGIDLNAKASSSGYCNLKEFKVENATVSASSSGLIKVYSSKSLEAQTSSSGSISFYGNPANVSKEESSSGSVTKK